MKIAIITHYYNSNNYGGCLQAYALCKLLNSNGYIAEQISYKRTIPIYSDKISQTIINIIKFYPRHIKQILIAIKNIKIAKDLSIRAKAFKVFNDTLTPHSKIFKRNTIKKCINDYDVFITGSDQVWNPLAYCSEYFLEFVPSNKKKLSYAASISQNQLNPEQLEFFKKGLQDFTSVSVREQNAIELLQDVAPVEVEWVLDPTMLLSKSQWNEICPPRIINEDYIFCYFLSDNENERRIAVKFAEYHKIKIITLPNLLGEIRKCDIDFGDYKLYDISPAQFISLIKYAKYIFTDSYHATVFSAIYQKQYFIFERYEHKSMSSRIYSLCKLFDNEYRFCNTSEKANFEYIINLPDIDYKNSNPEFEKMKTKSMKYLWKNLSKTGNN